MPVHVAWHAAPAEPQVPHVALQALLLPIHRLPEPRSREAEKPGGGLETGIQKTRRQRTAKNPNSWWTLKGNVVRKPRGFPCGKKGQISACHRLLVVWSGVLAKEKICICPAIRKKGVKSPKPPIQTTISQCSLASWLDARGAASAALRAGGPGAEDLAQRGGAAPHP